MKIELTLRDGTKVIVNFNLVQYVSCNKDGTAVINFGENDFFGVKETYAQVYKFLDPEVISG